MSTTRRQFLSATLGTGAVLSLGGTVPGFLLRAAAAHRDSADGRLLVVVQLTGGNDGLNTIIPYADAEYRSNRPTLRIGSEQVLKIDDSLGFHPSMRGCADLLEENQLTIVQGVGYDNPNRSHFESMDIWHTCRRKDELRGDGWLGRALDLASAGGGDVPAMHVGGEKQPLALSAARTRVPSIESLERFRLEGGDRRQLQQTLEQLTEVQRAESDSLLSFVQTSTSSALAASRRIEDAVRNYKSDVQYPSSGLAIRLRTVAQLIDAGLSTRIYYVELSGFDTHSQQAAAHAGLLGQFSAALHAFVQDLDQHGHGERTVVMSFSEFGRRVKENASEGTDHGAAAPMILAGNKLRSGLIGNHPSLTDLQQGDLKHHTDFRQVYAAVLQDWLGWPAEPVLGGGHTPVDLFV